MTIDRRDFVLGSLAAAAAACGSHGKRRSPRPRPPTPARRRSPRQKTILILGGTGFLGPHIVAAALARGHTVTLFNRGKTHPGAVPRRREAARRSRRPPRGARRTASGTRSSTRRATCRGSSRCRPSCSRRTSGTTSSSRRSRSTSADDVVGADESAPLETIADPTNEDVKTNYGALKALCEQAAEAAMPGRVATIRPGLIVGPGDPTGRFTHWPSRLADGGEVLAPGDGTTPVQYIDGRDLAASWIVKVIEDARSARSTRSVPRSRRR